MGKENKGVTRSEELLKLVERTVEEETIRESYSALV